MFYSIIVPVYNRPDEIRELLESLCKQTYTNFEVLVIEDGSQNDCRSIIDRYIEKLDIHYHYKKNSGQGFSRNYGFERAQGDYFVVFDSDCIIPEHYFGHVTDRLRNDPVDVWGGPDRAHPAFSPLQKAISYVMTSPLTTGGIRGGQQSLQTFHPRSFNMGISREVFERTGGYRITRMGEDIEFSIRIRKKGFQTALMPEAWVYHKRRTSFCGFFRQLHFFGRARINIRRFHPDERSAIHWMPTLFLTYLVLLVSGFILLPLQQAAAAGLPLALYLSAVFGHSLYKTSSVSVSGLVVLTALVQLAAYGSGFARELTVSLIGRDKR